MSKFPHFLDDRLKDTGEAVGITRQAIPVTGCGVPYGSKTPWLQNFLEDRLTDAGKVVSLMRHAPAVVHPPPSKKIPGTHFC
jgi:hypothetical protein